MKTYLYTLAILLFADLTTVAQQKNTFELNGKITGTQDGIVYLQKFENKSFKTIDSAKVTDGAYQFKTKLRLPELYGLTTDQYNSPVYVFLENKKITASSDASAFNKSTKITGSDANDLFLQYKKLKDVKIDSFIRANPNSIVSAYVLFRDYSYLLNSEQLLSNVQLLSPSVQKSTYVSALKELAIIKKKVEPGQKATDFVSTDQFGKQVKLSDNFGKYLLVTFWAGWCPDCRKENPNLVKTYAKFHEKGLEVLGVSLDKDKNTWTNAIKNDNLTWKHVSDLAYWDSAAAKLYAVRWIPSNFLIAPDGTIIAQNLMGEELDKKLNELL